ncbi:MAG: SUMF1/EgtB/PvdO family nonheme iron enzyme [Pirellulales bacterium]
MKRQVFLRRGVLFPIVVLALFIQPFIATAKADLFGSGANSFDIEFVPIGQPGNPPDANPNPAGAVPYQYRMGKYEISEQMIDKANALGALGITKDTRGPDMPATSVTWYEAARFVNWLNESTGHALAYKFDDLGNFQLWQPVDPGYDPNNLYRNRRAFYFLPSLNEWHKAAYYDPIAGVYYDYPTGSDSVPDGIDSVGDTEFAAVFFDGGLNSGPNEITNVGLTSAYGTAGQGGNVEEWEESAFDRINNIAGEHRSDNGGTWQTALNVLAASHTGIGIAPSFEGQFLGLRVATVPEPSSLSLFVLWLSAILMGRRFTFWRYSRPAIWTALMDE